MKQMKIHNEKQGKTCPLTNNSVQYSFKKARQVPNA